MKTRARFRAFPNQRLRYHGDKRVLARSLHADDWAIVRRHQEERQFWQRRLVAVLGIANTVAALALANAFIQSDDRVGTARLIVWPLPFFVVGIVATGFCMLCMAAKGTLIMEQLFAGVDARRRQGKRSRMGPLFLKIASTATAGAAAFSLFTAAVCFVGGLAMALLVIKIVAGV